MTRALLLAALLVSAPAFAHGNEGKHADASEHAKKGEHEDAPTSFAAKPRNGTWAKCPVSGEVFKIGKKTQFAQHEGRWYAFCCPNCSKDFAADPAQYAGKPAGEKAGQK